MYVIVSTIVFRYKSQDRIVDDLDTKSLFFYFLFHGSIDETYPQNPFHCIDHHRGRNFNSFRTIRVTGA